MLWSSVCNVTAFSVLLILSLPSHPICVGRNSWSAFSAEVQYKAGPSQQMTLIPSTGQILT